MKFEQIEIGQKAEIKHRITLEDLESFVRITGDDNQLHVNEKFASRTSLRKPVVHGMLSASFISTIIGTRIPGDGALWYEQHLEFLQPVRVGDQINVQAEVVKKIERLKVIELRTDIYNQHKQKVISGTSKVKIVENDNTEPKSHDPGEKTYRALIIGATGGIGSAVAHNLAALGYDIVLHYNRNKDKALALKDFLQKENGVRAYIYKADIGNSREVTEMFEFIKNRIGYVNRLVHSATGPVPNISFVELEWEDYQNQIDIHVKGFFNLIRSFSLQCKSYGKVVGISSQTTDYPFSDLSPYTTAKSAMEGLIRSLALDLSKNGIRLNMVSPGITETDLNANLPQKARLLAASRTPLKRLAQPDDVANAIHFLLSDASDYLTGQTIKVNGGVIMN